jgi:hypothetical protein
LAGLPACPINFADVKLTPPAFVGAEAMVSVMNLFQKVAGCAFGERPISSFGSFSAMTATQ